MYFLQFWRLEVQGEGSCICQGPLCHTIHRQGQKGRKYEREREREKERVREFLQLWFIQLLLYPPVYTRA
jgi:hypothetical protein